MYKVIKFQAAKDTAYIQKLCNKNFRPGKNEDNAIKPSDVAKLIAFIAKDRKGMILDEINLSQTKKVIEFL